MIRTSLRVAQILVCTLGLYLAICMVTHPPRAAFSRIKNRTVLPEVILSERRLPGSAGHYMPGPSEVVPNFSMGEWREWGGMSGGPLDYYWETVSRPDRRQLAWWLAEDMLLASGLALLLQAVWRRIPERAPKGFDVIAPSSVAGVNV